MKKLKSGWSVEFFSIEPTYAGLYEGNPKDILVKEIIIKNAGGSLKNFGLEHINILNTDSGSDERLPFFRVSFIVVDYMREIRCGVVIFLEEVDSIFGCIENVLNSYPDLKKDDWFF